LLKIRKDFEAEQPCLLTFCCEKIVLFTSDVVETVTSETETWLKFGDETEIETFS